MKKALAALCFALVFSPLLEARTAVPSCRPPASAAFSRLLGEFISFLRRPWRILPEDGGHEIPPPSSPATLSGS